MPVTVLDAHLRLNARADFSFPAHHPAALLVMRGEVTLNGGATAKASDFVVFRSEGEVISLAARSDAHVLVLSGEPIDEPIAAYGPFVMNTEREIREAMSDFQRGKIGHLEDEVPRAGEAS
jgi:redox-sensitive bicupin YhaK (pirin superfamily)